MDNVIIRDKSWEKLAEALFRVKKQREAFEREEKYLADQLRALSEFQSSAHGRWAYTVTYVRGTVDYKRIPELAHVDLDAYRKDPVAIWKLQPIPE